MKSTRTVRWNRSLAKVRVPKLSAGGLAYRGYTDEAATQKKLLHNVFRKGDQYFRSGDLLRRDEDGFFYFVDRIGDTFRWKGENVSTTEVEKVANSFDEVSLSAVYGVTMPGGDGRAGMAAIIPECDQDGFDLAGLADHFQRSLPSYAIPKFIRMSIELACTPTHKIKKVDLKKEGFDPDATHHYHTLDTSNPTETKTKKNAKT